MSLQSWKACVSKANPPIPWNCQLPGEKMTCPSRIGLTECYLSGNIIYFHDMLSSRCPSPHIKPLLKVRTFFFRPIGIPTDLPLFWCVPLLEACFLQARIYHKKLSHTGRKMLKGGGVEGAQQYLWGGKGLNIPHLNSPPFTPHLRVLGLKSTALTHYEYHPVLA